MNTLVLILLVSSGIVLCVLGIAFFLIARIAAGSPDVNGEKERDAGAPPEPAKTRLTA